MQGTRGAVRRAPEESRRGGRGEIWQRGRRVDQYGFGGIVDFRSDATGRGIDMVQTEHRPARQLPGSVAAGRHTRASTGTIFQTTVVHAQSELGEIDPASAHPQRRRVADAAADTPDGGRQRRPRSDAQPGEEDRRHVEDAALPAEGSLLGQDAEHSAQPTGGREGCDAGVEWTCCSPGAAERWVHIGGRPPVRPRAAEMGPVHQISRRATGSCAGLGDAATACSSVWPSGLLHPASQPFGLPATAQRQRGR
jgi:hypothetical protein